MLGLIIANAVNDFRETEESIDNFDFTVPDGIPKITAISLTEMSS